MEYDTGRAPPPLRWVADGDQYKKQTCAQCKHRKVRCDGNHSVCGNCSRLGFECSFSASSGNDALDSTAAPKKMRMPPKKMRISKACKSCHLSKLRCDGQLPKCRRCVAKDHPCVYPENKNESSPPTVFQAPSPEVPNLEPLHTPDSQFDLQSRDGVAQVHGIEHHVDGSLAMLHTLVSPQKTEQALRQYFDHFQRLPGLAFLHKASTLRLNRIGQANPALLASINAVTSCLNGSSGSERSIGSQCADLAEELILKNISCPSIFNVQALLLLTRYRTWTGRRNDAFMLMAVLTRSAFALNLHYETLERSFFIQESRRRLMWAIYILDTVISRGRPAHALCPIKTIHLRLPSAEDDFELDNENRSEKLNHSGSPPKPLGIIAYYIRIVNLHDNVLRYTQQAAECRTDFGSLLQESQRIERDLENFNSRLPAIEVFNERNLQLRAFSPRLSRYVMTHVWWHQCHCQLFRGTFSIFPGAFSQGYRACFGDSGILESQVKCLTHAHATADILASLLGMDCDTWILDFEMAECAYYAAEVLLTCDLPLREHLSLTTEQVTQDATACLQLIKMLSGMYEAASHMAVDLEKNLQNFSHGQPFRRQDAPYGTRTGPNTGNNVAVIEEVSFVDDSYVLEFPISTKPSNPTFLPDKAGSTLSLDPLLAPYRDGYKDIQRRIEPNLNVLAPEPMQTDDAQPGLEFGMGVWDELSLFNSASWVLGQTDMTGIAPT